MQCDFIFFSEHALVKMAERGIEPEVVEAIIKKGKIIKTYPDDVPSQSWLILGFQNSTPIYMSL